MCGIVGVTGTQEAAAILIEGLKRLEYRGIIAIQRPTPAGPRRTAADALGHERPNRDNAHPHMSIDGKVALVHNGIIENYAALKVQLGQKGTQVLQRDRHRGAGAPDRGVLRRQPRGCGARGAGQVDGDVRHRRDLTPVDRTRSCRAQGEPAPPRLGENENFLASDVSAILAHTRQVVYLEDGEMAVIDAGRLRVIDMNAIEIHQEGREIDWDLAQIERGGYDHFMLKEIFEQPRRSRTRCAAAAGRGGDVKLGGINLDDEELLANRQRLIRLRHVVARRR
jgi:glucosamine--fructose-6-phosphate aminotransferase (isomerizing)